MEHHSFAPAKRTCREVDTGISENVISTFLERKFLKVRKIGPQGWYFVKTTQKNRESKVMCLLSTNRCRLSKLRRGKFRTEFSTPPEAQFWTQTCRICLTKVATLSLRGLKGLVCELSGKRCCVSVIESCGFYLAWTCALSESDVKSVNDKSRKCVKSPVEWARAGFSSIEAQTRYCGVCRVKPPNGALAKTIEYVEG